MRQQLVDEILDCIVGFHRCISDAARIHYGDLVDTADVTLAGEGLSGAIRNYFDRISAVETVNAGPNAIHDVADAAARIADHLNAREKILFSLLLFKSLPFDGNSGNRKVTNDFTIVFEALKIPAKDAMMLHQLFNWDEGDKQNTGLWITGDRPDFNKVVDGFRVIYLPGTPVRMWCVQCSSCDLVLTRILKNQTHHKNYFIRENDVLPMTNQLIIFLNLIDVKPDKIAKDLMSDKERIPYVFIPPTEATPAVTLDPDQRRIDIIGHSVGVNPRLYFDPILRWIERLKELPTGDVELHIFLNYFNTYSSKVILEIFFRIKKYEMYGWNVILFWHYQSDDDDLRETGENYEEIVRGDFRMVEHDVVSRLMPLTT